MSHRNHAPVAGMHLCGFIFIFYTSADAVIVRMLEVRKRMIYMEKFQVKARTKISK
jgi:hypothetical protein